MDFALTDEQAAIRDMARDFGRERIAPHALAWEAAGASRARCSPRRARLGFAAMYVPEELGGAGLSRLDAALVFEALAEACPAVSSFISIHNMCAWMLATLGHATPPARATCPAPSTLERILRLLPDRARLRLGRRRAAHPRRPHRRRLDASTAPRPSSPAAASPTSTS